MFIVLLKFSENKSQAGNFMQAHKNWIQQGYDDGIFLLVGSLQPALGGGILVHNIEREDLHKRINNDPFVEQNIVSAEVIEISPNSADERLNFLMA